VELLLLTLLALLLLTLVELSYCCCLGSSNSWINYYYVYFQDCSLRFSVFRGLLWRLTTLSST